jgi:hypothetical protein
MAVGCFVSTGRSLDKALERVRLAESLGYEGCFQGRVSRTRKLSLGRYRLVITAMTLGVGSTSKTLDFAIVK